MTALLLKKILVNYRSLHLTNFWVIILFNKNFICIVVIVASTALNFGYLDFCARVVVCDIVLLSSNVRWSSMFNSPPIHFISLSMGIVTV
jgi:hypothetical protein